MSFVEDDVFVFRSVVLGLLNISLPWRFNARDTIEVSSRGEWSKKSVQQGRSPFGARSVLAVREHGTRARTPLAAFFNIPVLEILPPPVSFKIHSRIEPDKIPMAMCDTVSGQ